MILEKKLKFEGTLSESEFMTMFDSGASYSCIKPEVASLLDNLIKIRHPFKIETATTGNFIDVNNAVRLDFYIDNVRFSDEFYVVPNLSEDVIIGASTMQKWRFKLDFDNEELIIDPRATRLRI